MPDRTAGDRSRLVNCGDSARVVSGGFDARFCPSECISFKQQFASDGPRIYVLGSDDARNHAANACRATALALLFSLRKGKYQMSEKALQQGALTLVESDSIVEGALSAARRLEINVCVAVCNREGRLIAFKCMDGTYAEAGRQAVGKAVASAATGQPSGEISGIVDYPAAATAYAEGMPVSRIRGGLPILRDRTVVGGCGVGGGPANESDEECARAGIAMLHARPG